jgi:hypothetical protein
VAALLTRVHAVETPGRVGGMHGTKARLYWVYDWGLAQRGDVSAPRSSMPHQRVAPPPPGAFAAAASHTWD